MINDIGTTEWLLKCEETWNDVEKELVIHEERTSWTQTSFAHDGETTKEGVTYGHIPVKGHCQ